jgi:hypothetical protein
MRLHRRCQMSAIRLPAPTVAAEIAYGRFEFSRAIEAIADFHEQAFLAHRAWIAARNADGGEISRSNDASFSRQSDCSLSECWFGRLWH